MADYQKDIQIKSGLCTWLHATRLKSRCTSRSAHGWRQTDLVANLKSLELLVIRTCSTEQASYRLRETDNSKLWKTRLFSEAATSALSWSGKQPLLLSGNKGFHVHACSYGHRFMLWGLSVGLLYLGNIRLCFCFLFRLEPLGNVELLPNGIY